MRKSIAATALLTAVGLGMAMPVHTVTDEYTQRYTAVAHKTKITVPPPHSPISDETIKKFFNPKFPNSMDKPCPTEDSVNCYWNAKKHGNGKGHSFIVRQFPGKAKLVCVMYTERRYSRLDYCT